MRPPICAICNKDFRASSKEGGLITFKLTQEDAQFNERFKSPGFVGHPRGREWFCGDHYEAAKQLKHLTFAEALQKLSSKPEPLKKVLTEVSEFRFKEIKTEYKFESSYGFITDKLINRTHFLNNLCSITSSNNYIFYSADYFLIVNYKNNQFAQFDIYTEAQWNYIVLLQERFTNWEKNLISIEKLPFDLNEFDNRLSDVLNKFLEIRNDNTKVLGLPMYDGTFHATYVQLSGYYYFHDSTEPPKIINRLGYFERKSSMSPVNWNQLVFYTFKEIVQQKDVPILTINSNEKERLKGFTSKFEWLRKTGFDFEQANCFEYFNGKHTNICLKKNSSLYFIELNNTNSNVLIERYSMVFALDICKTIFKNANKVKISTKANQWLNLISADGLNNIFQENKNAKIAFGPFQDSYVNQLDKSIKRKYDSEPKNLLRHLHFIEANDWFLKLETHPI